MIVTSQNTNATASVSPNTTSTLLRLRIIELFAFFLIVFIAKEIASFHYPSMLFGILFSGALALQLAGPRLLAYLSKMRREHELVPLALPAYSGAVDLLVVLGIVYLTGTIVSPFLFLLVVPLFFASHLFSWKTTVGYFLVLPTACIALLGYLELQERIRHFNPYLVDNALYVNPDYYVGSLLVLCGFLGLMLFLSNAFQHHFRDSLDSLRRKDQLARHKIQELSRLYDISLGINAVMTVETLLKMVAKEATILLGQPWASVVLFDVHGAITHAVVVGIPDNYLNAMGTKVRKGGLNEWLLERGEPLVINDVSQSKRASTGDFLIATNIRSLIGLPLSNGHQVIGGIYVGDFVPKKFQDQHLRLLTIMSDQLAIAIAKSKLYESVKKKIDGLEATVSELSEVNALKSEFVSHVSHELRTPLTSIKAYLDTLSYHIDDPSFKERKDFLNIVSKETERLIRIVNDVLDVSNIEFGQRTLQRTRFNIEDVIKEVISMLLPKFTDKHISINLALAPHLPRVDADKDLVTQVFINLLTNALKYSPQGTTVTVHVEEDAVDLRISIEDEGIGIPEGQIGRIFDKYYRVKSEESKHYDGVGLGLAIVKNIIDQHGGTIEVESKEYVGSKFIFSLPKEHCATDLLGYIADNVDDMSELHDMLNVIVRVIAELLSAKIISLMLLDQSRSEMFIKVSYGLDEWVVEQARVKMGEGIAGKVAETGLPLLIDNIEQNEVYNSPNNPQYETMSLLSVPLKLDGIVVGVINVNNKTSGQPFNEDDLNLLTSFADRISVTLDRMRRSDGSAVQLQETVDAFKKMLESQIQQNSIEQKIDMAVRVARRLGLSEKDVKVIQYVTSVHDIGMTKISDDILNKTFNLTPEEIKEIQSHPHMGTELIRPLEFVELVSNIILYHHERVDGFGYPMGLKGEEIPVGARILAIVDAFQSMTSDRPYRAPVDVTGALQELVGTAGKQFDEEIVGVFIEVLEETGRISSQQAKNHRKTLKGAAEVRTGAGKTR